MDYPQSEKLFAALGYEWNSYLEFCEALRKCGKQSVDAFLEYRPEYIPVGKLAMAAVLIGYEN